MGNSFMRQVFEAAVCRWSNNITGGRLRTKGPAITRRILPHESHLSRLSGQTTMAPPCHGQFVGGEKPVSTFYRGGLPEAQAVPLNATDTRLCGRHGHPSATGTGLQFCGFPACSDDLATIEFDGRLRLHFVFRPYAYAYGLAMILKLLGVHPNHVDVVVCNDRCDRKLTRIAWARTLGGLYKSRENHTGKTAAKGAFFLDFSKVRATMQAQMLRDVGRLYGATNAVLTDDGHPCMPGLPDDEVDILFQAIRHGEALVAPEGVNEKDAEFWLHNTSTR